MQLRGPVGIYCCCCCILCWDCWTRTAFADLSTPCCPTRDSLCVGIPAHNTSVGRVFSPRQSCAVSVSWGSFLCLTSHLPFPIMYPYTPQLRLWKRMQKSWCSSYPSLSSFFCISIMLMVSYSGMKEKNQIVGFGYLEVGGVCKCLSLGCPRSHTYRAGSMLWNFTAPPVAVCAKPWSRC